MIKINGITIRAPKSMSVTISDVDSPSTTRNAKGDLVRDRVNIKRKIDLDFPPMKQSEMQTLLSAVQDQFFTVEFLDPQLGVITRTMYVGDRSSPLYRHGNGTTDVLWENVKFNLVER